jgi:hypothetical protein
MGRGVGSIHSFLNSQVTDGSVTVSVLLPRKQRYINLFEFAFTLPLFLSRLSSSSPDAHHLAISPLDLPT